MSLNHETVAAGWLERMTWLEAQACLRADPIVAIPLGAAAKEHGPHLPLNNDALIADWLTTELTRQVDLLVAPLVNQSFYPAFSDYPGSISLRRETARDLIVDICLSLAAHGAKRFYVVNTGVSTVAPLTEVQRALDTKGLVFDFLRLDAALERLPADLLQQKRGSHADEHETSLMLHIAPQVVDMSKACDDGLAGEGALRRKAGKGVHSPSGVFGEATLATADKGAEVAAALVSQALDDIAALGL